jgi:acetyl esterase
MIGRATNLVATALLRHPGWLTALLRVPPEPDSAELDPQLAALLAIQVRSRLPRLETLEPTAARRLSSVGLSPLEGPSYRMEEILEVAGVGAASLRVYRPHRRGHGLLVYFHGGGGVVGSIDGSDAWCRFLAFHGEVQVAAVEYRLAPEHRHPAAIEDAISGWRWAVANGARLGATRLAVGGDSFGGYLAAMIDQATSRAELQASALPAAAGLPPPALQLLLYPLTDLTMSLPSHRHRAEGFLLTGPMMRWFRGHYLGTGAAAAQRAASPLWLEAMPRAAPALVVLAGFDPLLDEGRAYARRLADEAGAEVEVIVHPGLIHGFAAMTGAVARARAAGLGLCDRLRARLSG